MLFGRLPSESFRGLAGAYGGAGFGLDPAQHFLNRFGPYRLQPYAIPSIDPSFLTAPSWFQPRGLPEEPLPRPEVWRLGSWGGGNGRGSNSNETNTGRGRGGIGARGVDRSGGAVGGKASGPGGPSGGRSGPVSR
jgi:hypothetical protein